MNIMITLDCSVYNKGQFDISMNSEQIIENCLQVVNEGLALNLDLKNINYCKSKRNNSVVTMYSTFKESNIHTGDILTLL